MAHELVVAEVGRQGLSIPLVPFTARLGGAAALRKVLGALTVAEKIHPGKPRGMARTIRRAYAIVGAHGAKRLLIPRVKGPAFLRARTRAGLPLLDEVRAAADALPAPRRLEAGRCALEEPLYPYQEAAVEYLCGAAGPFGAAAAAACRGVAYLQMDTGLGKTRVGCAVAARLGAPALVVVPTQSIGEQWVDELKELCPEMVAGVFHNPPKRSRRVPPGPRTHDLVVVIVNTFREKGPSFLEGFGLVILDEAHEYHSAHNSRALWLAQTPAVLGLSATPEERADGLDLYVHLHLGPVVRPEAIPGFDAGAVNFRGEVRVLEYVGHPAHCETATTPSGTMSAILTIGNIIEDPCRLRLVAAEVERLYRLHETAPPEELARLGLGPRPESAATPAHPAGEVRRHGVFVFAEHRKYLPALRAVLLARFGEAEVFAPELEPAERPTVSILRGGVARAEVRRARRAGAHIVLVTFGFGRRGLSLPDMTAIVEATPRRNGGRQLLGRVLRRGSDESIVRQVVDIVDVRTGLKGQASDRRKVYKAKAWPISKLAASWEEHAGAPEEPAPPGAPDAPNFAAMPLNDLLAAARGDRAPPGDGAAPDGAAPGGAAPAGMALGGGARAPGLVYELASVDIDAILGW
jgi:hypothetical protein